MEVKDTEGLTDYTSHALTVDDGGGNGCDGQTSLTTGGQTYDIVKIEDQCWMAQNMNYEIGNSWCYENDPFTIFRNFPLTLQFAIRMIVYDSADWQTIN